MKQTIVGYNGIYYDAELYMASNFINMMKYEELKEKFNDSKAIENCQYMIDIFKKEYERAASMFSEEEVHDLTMAYTVAYGMKILSGEINPLQDMLDSFNKEQS